MTLRIYLTALVSFLVFDLVWLGVIDRGFYRDQIGFVLRETVFWPGAIAFYLLFVAALVHFAIAPQLKEGTLAGALANAAFFGLATYAAYDLTNLATTKDWPLLITLVDLSWGAVLSALVALVTFKLNS